VSGILDERAQIRLLTDTIRQVLAEERRRPTEPAEEGRKTIERDGNVTRVRTDLGRGRARLQTLEFDETTGEVARVTSHVEEGPDLERVAELRRWIEADKIQAREDARAGSRPSNRIGWPG
jgi:hypothetical protein